MQLNLYNSFYQDYFNQESVAKQIFAAIEILKTSKRVFFIGNGGSNSICSHMMEDYAKIGRFPTFAFSDAALITCYANDYGYEKAMEEWLKVHWQEGDLLVAISSSGNSMNIVNAASFVKAQGGNLITLSGFSAENKLVGLGQENFYLPIKNYGIVECFHQVILHVILDEYAANK